MKFKQNSANIITFTRIVFSVLLLIFPLFSIEFWIFYSLAGLSDFTDGIVARKLGIESKTGALLDSVADIVFFIIIAFLLLSKITLPLWIIISIIVIALIRILAYFIAFYKFHSFISIHTYLNKLTGLCLFFSPLMFYLWNLEVSGIILVSVAYISSLEELLIEICSKEEKRDCKGLFIK